MRQSHPSGGTARQDIVREFPYRSNNRRSTMQRSDRPDTTPPEWSPTEVAKLPLPRDMAHFAGLYKHPAYGVINLTLSRADTDQENATSFYLYGMPTPARVLNYSFELYHMTDTLFTCKLMLPHGMGSEVTLEHVATSRAVFKFVITGETVETVGIELEREMVEAAKRKGGKHWGEGMIWFDRI